MRHFLIAAVLVSALPAAAHRDEAPCLQADDGTLVCPEMQMTAPVALAADEDIALAPADTAAAVKEEAQTESAFLKFLGALLTLLMPVIALLVKNWRDVMLAKKQESHLNMGIGIALQLFAAFLTEARAKLEPKLREALADGVVTPAERKELVDVLVQMALTGLPSAVMDALNTAFGDSLKTWLAHQATETVDAALAKASGSPQ
jgi:hypothetical protein